MKILHVLNWSMPTLAGYTVRADCILRSQRELGWQVAGITGAVEKATTEEVNGIRFYRTPGVAVNAPGLREWAMYRALRHRLRAVAPGEQPTLLHAHSPMYCGFAALRVAREMGIPCVYEMRAVWEDAAVDAGKFSVNSPQYKVARNLETALLRRVDAVVTICEGLKQDVLSRGIEARKVFVVPNAIEAGQFEPMAEDPGIRAELGWEQGGFVFGFLGSLYDYEGVHDLVEAIPQVLERVPGTRLLIVGSGERETLIRERIEKIGLPGRVIHKPRVPHSEVRRLYSTIDCLVYPRRNVRLTNLVTPLKPLEAMGMQKAVVASDVGGHLEMVEHEKTGLLYRADDNADLVNTLCRMASEPGLAARLSANGRRYVLQQRTWGVVVHNYVSAYETALGRSVAVPTPSSR